MSSRYFLFLSPLILTAGFFIGRNLFFCATAADDSHSAKVEPVTELPKDLFKNWGKPDQVLVVTGQTHGYLQPCGCSSPQYGGLTRRYNVIQMMKKRGWDVAAIDIGDLFPKKGSHHLVPDQATERYKTILRSLDLMNYSGYGVGQLELRMPLLDGLAQAINLNLKKPVPLALNLKDPNKAYEALGVKQYDVLGSAIKVGVTSLVGPGVAKAVAGPNLEFFGNPAILPPALAVLAKNKVDVVVLLYHGEGPVVDNEVEACAKFCANLTANNPAIPAVNLILHNSDFDTPPGRPTPIKGTPTQSLYMGHSGKYMGVFGFFRKENGGVDTKFELVSLGPQFDTPKGEETNHAVMNLMEEYAQTVKNRDFLSAYKPFRVPHATKRALAPKGVNVKYVGSEVCIGCHQHAGNVWANSGHSHAFETLEKVKNPSLREFDPECIYCHTVGFKYEDGYFDPPAGLSVKKAKDFNESHKNVGCESCHGPGSMHANNPQNAEYYPLINPLKLDSPANFLKLDFFCQSCHDIENDVNWGKAGRDFQSQWKKIAHPSPKKKD